MRFTQFFIRTQKEWPRDEESANARFLHRGGFIEKIGAGVYAFLPLGLRVLDRINRVIREEMNAIGASELLLPALIPKKYWEATGRWNVPVLYKSADSSGQEYGLGFTHEEVLTPILARRIQSFRDLPQALYQIQTKFRDEPRARFGLIRGKEFVMKDLYSFHADIKDLERFYWVVSDAYKKIFSRLGLPVTVVEAAGGDFTKEFTHEFQVLTPVGEDTIFYCAKCDFAQNKEVAKVSSGDGCPKCQKGKIEESNGIEVGNIFRLGTKFSEAANLVYKDSSGKEQLVVMGSYGIGPSRAMGAIVELNHDDAGIRWPKEAAPFEAHLVALPGGEEQADAAYEHFTEHGFDILYDDRADATPGEKLADADLIGIGWRIVASAKTALCGRLEIKARDSRDAELLTPAESADRIRTSFHVR
ncbi:MAG: hypothetical protein HYS44_02730 [Candidatus Niyogibacteria bacterium]|nr:hypothetical protein [Candidatus Niyogibacteria bacterium]